MKLPIHRSRSVPMLNKEGNSPMLNKEGISPVPGMFRIVLTTLRLDDKIATTPMTSPIHDTGNISFLKLLYERYVNLRIFNNLLYILIKLNYSRSRWRHFCLLYSL